MIFFKRLHWFMLKTFLPLFAMTFFIVLFIVLMQFLWRYIDDLVGKGLGIGVIGELFFYAAVSMVPMALPLAILLASLMTFGNLGEKFELTAMKASGISLVRVMKPLIVTVALIAIGAFFFQNDILPKAQVKMWTLLFSMRQKSPELEIPEEVFYDQIPGFNLYVKEKNRDTGMLYGVLIYDVSKGGDNASIITADSSVLAFTPDMRYLYLHLYNGEQFENLRDQNRGLRGNNIPFRRETFLDKEVLIPFDANFNRLDEEGMRNQYVGKNIRELRETMDSVGHRIDSIGRAGIEDLRQTELPFLNKRGNSYSQAVTHSFSGTISSAAPAGASYEAAAMNSEPEKGTVNDYYDQVAGVRIDTLLSSLPLRKQSELLANALSLSGRRQQNLIFRAQVMADEKKILRRHDIELVKKFTLSVACIIFFFIGAPLGAIIRKGGIGTPLVISVLLFLFYYIIDNTGYKMARDGRVEVWVGMWLSTFILAPLGIYVTRTAMNDSAVFDKDKYIAFMRRLIGARGTRNIAYKEIIINEINSSEALLRMERLKYMAERINDNLSRKPSFIRYWMEGIDCNGIRGLAEELDNDVNYLSDCRDPQIISNLSDFPIIVYLWVYHPVVNKRWLSRMMIVLFPLSLPIYFAGLRARLNLMEDCRDISLRASQIELLLRKDSIINTEDSQQDPDNFGSFS